MNVHQFGPSEVVAAIAVVESAHRCRNPLALATPRARSRSACCLGTTYEIMSLRFVLVKVSARERTVDHGNTHHIWLCSHDPASLCLIPRRLSDAWRRSSRESSGGFRASAGPSLRTPPRCPMQQAALGVQGKRLRIPPFFHTLLI